MTIGGKVLRGKNHPSYGKPVPLERREKIRQKAIGRSKSTEELKKLSDCNSGKNNPMYGQRGELAPGYKRVKSKEEIEKIRQGHFKMVKQIDLETGKVIKIFNSIVDAGKSINIKTHGNISTCCRGKKKSVGGFNWEYA